MMYAVSQKIVGAFKFSSDMLKVKQRKWLASKQKKKGNLSV